MYCNQSNISSDIRLYILESFQLLSMCFVVTYKSDCVSNSMELLDFIYRQSELIIDFPQTGPLMYHTYRPCRY